MFYSRLFALVPLLLVLALPQTALAADSAYKLSGDNLSLIWGIPFVGILLSIAIFPCLLYTSPSPRDGATSRMPSSA